MRRIILGLVVGAVLARAAPAAAVTWSAGTSECPVCKKTVKVQRVASYGSYVYRYPSKYQLVFWPHTDSHSWYFCDACHYSAFMGDFATLPADQVPAVRAAIAKLKQPQPPKAYFEIPLGYRLRIAAAVSRVLGRDDLYWCHFERVHGYHLARLGDAAQAKAARLRSLALAQQLLRANAPAPTKKELTFLIGALQHFTGQSPAALETLALVPQTPAAPKGKLQDEQLKSFGQYLDELAKALGALIAKHEKVPE